MELDFGSEEGKVSKGDFLLDLKALAENPKIKKRDAKVLIIVALMFRKRFGTRFTMSDMVLYGKLMAFLLIKAG